MSEPTLATTSFGQSGSVPNGADTLSHGRYRLGELIGCGAFGQVHRAVDTLTGDTVAVKLVSALSPTDLERARRELAALRWLRVPGVVRLRDDGLEGRSWFLVLDLVEGRRFDALSGWAACEGPALELLEILARVHLAGVLHLDLKPGNLMVTPEGRVVVLDFGIARGSAVPEFRAGVEGTPRYMAPEQRQGKACDPRTDLYAVGTMLLELCPDAPNEIRAALERMAAPELAERMPSALEAHRALAGRSPFPEILNRTDSWTAESLRTLFPSSDRFTHLGSDAAALLWSETGGQPGAVRTTVERWILAGQVSWSDRGLVVDRLGLDRLSHPVDLLADDFDRLVEGSLVAARSLREQGRIRPALALLDAVIGLGPPTEKLLGERVRAALQLQSTVEADLALHALERAGSSAQTAKLGALVRLFIAVQRGERARAQEAVAIVERLGPFEDPELDARFQASRVPVAALDGLDAERAVLNELGTWAGTDPERCGLLEGWWGQHWYRCGRFREAALAQERAASAKATAIARLASLGGAAAAWLEVPDLPRAERLAGEAVAQAAEIRHPRFEAWATWMLRTAAYRAGRPHPIEDDLLDAVVELGADLEAPFALTEAAAAWRLGDPQALALADRAARRFTEISSPGAELSRAFAAFLRGDRDLTALVDKARGGPVPDLELQVLAFARWQATDPPPDWLERSRVLAANRPPETWSIRLDVLSVEEALAASPPDVGHG